MSTSRARWVLPIPALLCVTLLIHPMCHLLFGCEQADLVGRCRQLRSSTWAGGIPTCMSMVYSSISNDFDGRSVSDVCIVSRSSMAA